MVVKNTKMHSKCIKNTKYIFIEASLRFLLFSIRYKNVPIISNGTKNKQEIFKSMVEEMKRNERENFSKLFNNGGLYFSLDPNKIALDEN